MADEVERELDVTEDDVEGQKLHRNPSRSDEGMAPGEGMERKPTMSVSEDDDVEGQMFVRTRTT